MGSVLPEVCLWLPAELERVDAWLGGEAFFEPFRAHFDARLGRPSVPIETYLRLTFLTFRYRLEYQTARAREPAVRDTAVSPPIPSCAMRC